MFWPERKMYIVIIGTSKIANHNCLKNGTVESHYME